MLLIKIFQNDFFFHLKSKENNIYGTDMEWRWVTWIIQQGALDKKDVYLWVDISQIPNFLLLKFTFEDINQ